MKNNILVVGAGFAGAIHARELADNNYTVTVIDKRDHVAGNCFDYHDTSGIRIHRYGPHLFHTSNLKVWNYINKFTEFNNYRHQVLTKHKNITVTNCDTIITHEYHKICQFHLNKKNDLTIVVCKKSIPRNFRKNMIAIHKY